MRFDILTLFPEMFTGPFSESILKRAQSAGLVEIHLWNIRDFATDKHRQVDDYPFGGGAGMVLKPEPVYRAVEAVTAQVAQAGQVGPVYLLTPQGELFNQEMAKQMATFPQITLICGHYEGFDERIRRLVTAEISIGDYVLTGGELPAMVIVDSVVRLLPGVLDNESPVDDSLYNGFLEYPQYTRPREFRGMGVPEVLLSGHHENIRRWRRRQSLYRTWEKRPDLLVKNRDRLTDEDLKWLAEFEEGRKDESEET